MAEFSDAEVSGELSDADVGTPNTPNALIDQTFFSGDFAKRYAAKALGELQQPGPGFMAGLPALSRFAGGFLGSIPGQLADGVADLFMKSHKAWNEGLTPQEESEFAFNAALTQIGSAEPFRLPTTKIPTTVEEFHEQVAKPIAQSLVDEATKIKPEQITIPLDPANIASVAEDNLRKTVDDVKEARDLGVVGGPREEVPADSPAVAAQRAIPATQKQGDKITMTPAGEPISDWEARFNDWVDRVQSPEEFKPFWLDAAKRNNNFIDARQGAVSPAHVESLIESAGLNPTQVDSGYVRQNFNTPDVVRMAKQTLDKLSQDFKDASAKVESDPTSQNISAMLQAEIKRDYALEQALGLRAEWGRTGHAWRSLLGPKEEPGTGLVEGLKMPKPVKDLTDAISKFRENATEAVTATGKDRDTPLGLDKLIQAAADLVDETGKPVKKGEKPSIPKTPEVNELVKTAQAVVNLLNIERPKLPGVDTVRPLRAILSEKSAQGQNALAKFNKIITEGEKLVRDGVQRQGKTPNAALTPELADLVQRADNVTSYFGGVGVQKAVEELLNGKGRTVEDMQNIARAVNRTDIKGAARLMSSMRNQNTSVLYWLWTQGLISGPFTHTKYALANATYALTERGIIAPMAAVIGKILGRADADRVLGSEALGGIWGLIRGVPDAFKAVRDTPWGQRYQLDTEKLLLDRLSSTGEEIPKDLLRSSQPFGAAPIPGLMGRSLGVPGYVAGDIHSFYKKLGEEAGKTAESFRAASLEGKKISDPDFWDRVDYNKANLSTEALLRIRDDAYRGTFMQKLPESMERWASTVKGGKYLRWMFPFTHIPINLMRVALEHTPLAIADPTMRADLFGRNGGRAQDKAIARILAGAAIMGYFANEYMQGRATGDYPKTKKEQDEWKLMGKIPYATQIGDEWHSFDKFGPAGALAGLGANIGHVIASSDKEDPENWTKMVWLAVEAAASTASDFPGFQTLQNFFRAKEDPNSARQFMAWQAGSLLPFSSLISQTASFTDPFMRRANTFVNGLMYRLPGIRESLAPKLDPLYGEPVPNPGYASVIRNVPVNLDPVKQELDRIGYYPTAPKQEIGGVNLTPDQYYKYQATAGPYVKSRLSEVMMSPMWKAHDNQPEWQREVAKAAIAEGRTKARAVMQADSMARDGANNLVAQGLQRRNMQIRGQ